MSCSGSAMVFIRNFISLITVLTLTAYGAVITEPANYSNYYGGGVVNVQVVTTSASNAVNITLTNNANYSLTKAATGSVNNWSAIFILPNCNFTSFTIQAVPIGSLDVTEASVTIQVLPACGTPSYCPDVGYPRASCRSHRSCSYYEENLDSITDFEPFSSEQ